MINKKLLAVASVAAVISASSAFAKTEGNYAAINAVRSSTSYSGIKATIFKDTGTLGIPAATTNPATPATFSTDPATGEQKFGSDSSFGAGFSYKYAINFGGVYIAPGIFAESINAESKVSSSITNNNSASPSLAADTYTSISMDDTTTVESKYRYGIKADIGYDITEDLAAYLVVGISNNEYDVKNQENTTTSTATVTSDGNPIVYGAGTTDTETYKDSVSKIGFIYGLGGSYNLSEDVTLNAEYNRQSVNFKFKDVDEKLKTTVSVAQVGIAYRF